MIPASTNVRSYRADQALGAEVFTDDICPANRYIAPADYHAQYSYDFAAFDALSPTSDVRELIWQVSQIAVDFGLLDHPYDVIDEAVKPLSGRLGRVRRLRRCLRQHRLRARHDAGCLSGRGQPDRPVDDREGDVGVDIGAGGERGPVAGEWLDRLVYDVVRVVEQAEVDRDLADLPDQLADVAGRAERVEGGEVVAVLSVVVGRRDVPVGRADVVGEDLGTERWSAR